MSARPGDTKPVWHVLGPGTPWQHASWWCFDSSEEADACASRMDKAQVLTGRAIYTDHDGSPFWAVKRPERIAPR